jgi:hypothetical protein
VALARVIGGRQIEGCHPAFSAHAGDWESLAAIRKVFPEAPVMPGEFAGTVGGSNGVDYGKVFKDLARGRDHTRKTVVRPVSSLVRSTHFLNSIGWLYSVLDHLREDRAWLVRPRQPVGSLRDVTAAVFTRPDRIIVLLASWAPAGDTSGQPERVQLRIPRRDLPFSPQIAQARTLAFDNATSVAGHWRRDLAGADNLKPEFAAPDVPPATLLQMARDPLVARRMVLTNRAKYEAAQQNSLTLQPLPNGLLEVQSSSGGPFFTLETLLEPNDLRVIVLEKIGKGAFGLEDEFIPPKLVEKIGGGQNLDAIPKRSFFSEINPEAAERCFAEKLFQAVEGAVVAGVPASR